jgi:hypothetical protein
VSEAEPLQLEEAQKIRDHFLAISTLKQPRRQAVHPDNN